MFLTLISKKKNGALNSKKGHILSEKKKKGTLVTHFTIKVPFFLICPFLLFFYSFLNFVKGEEIYVMLILMLDYLNLS